MALPQPVLGRNATPAWGLQAPDPAAQRKVLAAARKLQAAKRRADGGGRTTSRAAPGAAAPAIAPARAQSLRRVKDSKEQLRTTRARGTSNATTDSTPSTTPGRAFTVANINNGIIYLRPSVRPAHQRSRPLPEPIFPQTPPDSATLNSTARPTSDDWEKSVFDAWTPTRTEFALPPLPTEVKTDDDIKLSRPAYSDSPPRPATHHVRSRSFSTADEHTVSSHSVEPGTFKVVIERSGRPKTADTETSPILEVPIPSYRLGTPRFSVRGTAILRSSVHTSAAATEDYPSSFLLTPQRATHSFLSSRPRSDVYSPSSFNFRATMDLRPPLSSTEPSSARISKLPIGPQIYDALTLNPDDTAVVRFSPTGDILAATPSRLIAHITSPSFVDYELLSDFFLTFRSFLVGRELVAYLLSRLRWAVNRQDDFGRIVRVRTFVALRHWILNYFIDDFVPKYRLRVYFCELVNALYKDLKAREDGGGGDIKIIGELKKCWRRTCALYWDSEDRIGQDGADEDLLPGGTPGSLASVDETALAAVLPSTPPRDPVQRQVSDVKPETIGSNPSDQFASKHMDWAHRARHTPQNSLSSPHISSQVDYGVRVPLSPESERSLQVLSCSIPMRGLTKPEPAKDVPLYAYPVPHPAPAGPSRLTASPQQPPSTKQPNRPSHGHKRSGSFSDALRDNRKHLSFPKSTTSDGDITTVDITTISKIPGSLVRGGLFQPGSPYIDVKNGGLRHTRSRIELAHEDVVAPDVHFRGGYVANPGVKKLFGSVRRALSSKQPSASNPHFANTLQNHHAAPSTRSSNPATISTASGGVQKRRNTRPRPQVRVDVLASAVAESFKEAVQEQLKNEQQRPSVIPTLGGFEFDFEKRKSNSSQEQSKSTKHEDFRFNSGITTGSKSIVIMDDTGAPPLPVMSGALSYSDKESDIITTAPVDLTRVASIDEKMKADAVSVQDADMHREVEVPQDWQRLSRGSIQPSTVPQRRSVSLGRERMHSFRRRGSTKTSMARPASLRRHTSHASGLGRYQKVESIATFQTMSSDNDPFHLERQPAESAIKPTRQLRRRPGGDLRAADHVQDLEQGQRPHSTGSVSNRTHSIANSVILRSDRFIESTKFENETEDEAEDELTKKKQISLVDTHSSQPNLRPSFEAEVAKLAALPDDIDDDGGIESALMKLEGRYEKKSPDLVQSALGLSPEADVKAGASESPIPPVESSNPSYIPSEHESSQPRSYVKGDDVFHRPLSPPEAEGQEMYRLSGEAFNGRMPPINSHIESEDSYSSIPLLDRGVSEITRARAPTMETMRSSAKPAPLKPMSPVSRLEEQLTGHAASSNSSIEHIIKTDSMKRIPADATMPMASVPRESFLLDDDEDLSDMGSARRTMSDDSHGVRSFFDDETPVGETEKEFLPTHPMRHPPTPPLTANRLNDSLPQVDTTVFEKGLPTPGMTPTSRLNGQSFNGLGQSKDTAFGPQETKQESSSAEPPHLPFILAYDSETLAQQFTIIEKDALDEIDWRELIELRWKQSSPQISDWVYYLRTEEAKGVDVVIARFNLVVKWAVSEIVLTESIEERARCIVKYIHIASHARRLRNYATMYQITIALLSNDVSRMRKTWSLVPGAELQTIRELEALVQPLRNFHNLRIEMETATVEDGCIPFIGIYTRDLIYNAQKPAFIDAPPAGGEKLVNFERHQTAATIVKSLLRLLEASSRYTFNVEPNIISKCLWIAALSDDEIAKRSRQYD